MARIRIRSHHMDVDIKARPLAQRFKRLGDLRQKLIKRIGDEDGVDRLLEHHLTQAVGAFANHYFDQMGGTIERILKIRGEISPLYRGLLDGMADPGTSKRILGMLDDLHNEMDNIKSPTDFAHAQNKIEVPKDLIGDSPATHAAKQRQLKKLDGLKRAKPLERATEARLAELSEQEAQYRSAGLNWIADRAKRQLDSLHKWLTSAGAKERAAQLAGEVENSPFLSELNANGGEVMIRELWVRFDARRKNLKIKNFEEYVRANQAQVRGALGEFDTPFRLSDRHDMLKGPDHNINKPGTDLIALDRKNGEILVLDNKAYKGRGIDSVSALVENIVKNLENDAAMLEAAIGKDKKVPKHVQDAVGRLKAASAELRAKLNEMGVTDSRKDKERRKDSDVQLELKQILDKHNIRRVVTNTYGESVMNLAKALQDIGLDPENLE